MQMIREFVHTDASFQPLNHVIGIVVDGPLLALLASPSRDAEKFLVLRVS